MLMNKSVLFVISTMILLLALAFSGFVGAHGGASGVVKERMELMKSMGDRMKSIADMVKGKAPFDENEIAAGAMEIREKAPEIPHLFPEGSLRKPSEALPSVWQEWDRFIEMTDRLTREAGSLNDVAVTGSRREIMLQFTKVGKTCSSCHTDFREKQEK